MSITIRPSVENDIAEAILLRMWLRYLTGQWERYLEMERDVWYPATLPNPVSGYFELTQYHNLISKLYTKYCIYRWVHGMEVVITGWEPKVLCALVDLCSSPAILLLTQFSSFPSTYLFKANMIGRWKKRFFTPLKFSAPCIVHATEHEFKTCLKDLSWLTTCHRWGSPVSFSWSVSLTGSMESFKTLGMQIHLLMTGGIEGAIGNQWEKSRVCPQLSY